MEDLRADTRHIDTRRIVQSFLFFGLHAAFAAFPSSEASSRL